MTLFESLTGAKVKDCIINEKITFVVEKGNMGLAIGKQGKNLKRVESTIKKPIRAIEFDEDIRQFIKNYCYPLKDLEVEQNDKNINIIGKDTKTKALLIGRDRVNLKKMLNIVSRYFEVRDITVA